MCQVIVMRWLRRARGDLDCRLLAASVAACTVMLPTFCAFAEAPARDAKTAQAPTAGSDSRAATPRLNPTDRTLSLVVELRSGDRRLGEVAIKIAPGDEISVHKDKFVRACSPLLGRQHAGELRNLTAASGFLSLAVLNARGFRTRFDASTMRLDFAPAVDQRPRRSIRLRRGRDAGAEMETPARFSGYVNVRAAADYVSTSPTEDTGLRPPRADIEAALRWKGLVVEAEATYDAADRHDGLPASESLGRFRGLTRRSTRLIYDRPEDALRVQAGDIIPPVSGLQRSPDMLGISVERSLRKLQPGRNIRPTGKRSFRISRPSKVRIELNGITVRQIRLDPGQYDLQDLPLQAGANDVRLVITDDLGERRTLEFTSYFDASLLAEDIREWGFSLGIRSQYDGAALTYETERLIASGFYRRGLTPELTGEAHMQADTEAVMTGAALYSANLLGLFGVEAALSYHTDTAAGAAVEIDWEALRDLGYGGALRLAADLRTPGFATPGVDKPFERYWLSLLASYSRPLPFDIRATFSGRYALASDRARRRYGTHDLYSIGLGLSTRLRPTVGLGLSLRYSSRPLRVSLRDDPDDANDGEWRASLRLSWRPDPDTYADARFESGNATSSVSAETTKRTPEDTWTTRIEAVHDAPADDLGLEGTLFYSGNRLTATIAHDASLDANWLETRRRLFDDQRTTVHVGTAIAFADGVWSVGPPVGPGGFALVAPHETLDDRRVILGHRKRPRAVSDMFGPALVTDLPSYVPTQIRYDVEDLPIGYDLGDGVFDLRAPYKAGYALRIGSAHSVTAFGTLIGRDGEAVALLTGTAKPEDGSTAPVSVFTNGSGRFGAQGLAPGRWIIEMASAPVARFILDIPKGTKGLYRAGTLNAVPAEGDS